MGEGERGGAEGEMKGLVERQYFCTTMLARFRARSVKVEVMGSTTENRKYRG